MQEIVVIQRLLQRKVSRIFAGRIGDDSRHFLRDIAGHGPGFYRKLTGCPNLVVQLLAVRGRALRAATTQRDAPAAEPLVVSRQGQVERWGNAAGVVRNGAAAGLELPQPDLCSFVAIAAGCDDAIRQVQRLAVDEQWIEFTRRHSLGKCLDGGFHFRGCLGRRGGSPRTSSGAIME